MRYVTNVILTVLVLIVAALPACAPIQRSIELANRGFMVKPQQDTSDERYVYPGTKLRIKLGTCTMQGETVTCEVALTNTVDHNTGVAFENTILRDESRKASKMQKWNYLSGFGCVGFGGCIRYGETANISMTFPLVNPAASTVTISTLVKANKGSDFVIFENVSIAK